MVHQRQLTKQRSLRIAEMYSCNDELSSSSSHSKRNSELSSSQHSTRRIRNKELSLTCNSSPCKVTPKGLPPRRPRKHDPLSSSSSQFHKTAKKRITSVSKKTDRLSLSEHSALHKLMTGLQNSDDFTTTTDMTDPLSEDEGDEFGEDPFDGWESIMIRLPSQK